jgi:hypothetical protein
MVAFGPDVQIEIEIAAVCHSVLPNPPCTDAEGPGALKNSTRDAPGRYPTFGGRREARFLARRTRIPSGSARLGTETTIGP